MKHPAHLPEKNDIEIIRQHAAQADEQRKLTEPQLNIIYRNNWFNLFVPKEYGGLELSLPDALRLEETFAWIDGSFGWTITLCSGANWFIGFLEPEAREEIFKYTKACLAGSGRPSGIAKTTDRGYEITGKWDYATGAAHASIFTANCVVEKEGTIVRNDSGEPLVKSFWFKKAEVKIEQNWESTGMKATSSHSFKVNHLWVAENRAFTIAEKYTTLPQKIYQFPFAAFAECTLATNFSGMAMRFTELLEEITSENKKREKTIYPAVNYSQPVILGDLIDDLKLKLESTRSAFYNTIEEAWQRISNGLLISAGSLQDIGTNSRALAHTTLEITDQLYPYAGMIAAHPGSEINRVWLNLHTASQHTLMRYIE